MTDEPLPNPERGWERRPELRTVDRGELARCLGEPLAAEAEEVAERAELLSGGLANTNVRVGERVVRMYRRDPGAAAREEVLLRRGWRSFRVPAVVRAGSGFLVLEHVAHGLVHGTAKHGAAVGAALAEIHGVSFEQFGELDASLAVAEPYPDLVGTFVAYASTSFGNDPTFEPARRALEAAAPAMRAVAGRPTLLHADFKVSNLHWTLDDRLLVLDWEFAYSGAALSDIGQIVRWDPPPAFVDAFAAAYRAAGGRLVEDWPRWAAAFDLVNIAGLLSNVTRGERDVPTEMRDLSRRVAQTLAILSSRPSS